MMKANEIVLANSCWNKATAAEMVFILLGRDMAAPATIRFWINERVRLGKNQPGDDQIIEAEQCAQAIERLRTGGGV